MAQTWRPLRNSYVISAFIDAILTDVRRRDVHTSRQEACSRAAGVWETRMSTTKLAIAAVYLLSDIGLSIIGSRTRKTVRPSADSAVTDP